MRPSMPTRKRARRRSVRRDPADCRPAMNTRWGPGKSSATPIGKNPPSSASSRGRKCRRSSSAAVAGSRSGSLGEPIWLLAGTIRPRAPRRVFSQTSASWTTEPNSVGRAQLALADRPRVRVGHGDQPVGDLLAGQPLTDLSDDGARAIGQIVQAPGGSELALRAAAAGPTAQVRGQAARFADRALDQRAGLAGQPQRRRLAPARPGRQRPVELALAPLDRARAIANARRA
jgi:hypothetical protein